MRIFQQDLFGEELPAEEAFARNCRVFGRFKIFRKKHEYRKAKYGRWSYICCATCAYFIEIQRDSGSWFKCALMGVSSSSASDIRKGYVCNLHSSVSRPSETRKEAEQEKLAV